MVECVTGRRDELVRLLEAGHRRRLYPGAVWAVGDASGVLDRGVVGTLGTDVGDGLMQPDTIFDVASLTKVLAVWSAVGAVQESTSFSLEEPLEALWPEVAGKVTGKLTARSLLTHTAGQPLRANLRPTYGHNLEAIRRGVLDGPLRHDPGAEVAYTDRAALILGWFAEFLAGQRLDQLVTSRVWRPLGMHATRFGPLEAEMVARCAPTEFDHESGVRRRGRVHDYSARALGGVCGVAGVFSTTHDLGLFLQGLLKPVANVGFGPSWVAESLTVQTGRLSPAIGYLWQLAPETDPADGIWMHYGFTGTAMWISPKHGLWAVLLTNKLYFTRDKDPLMDLRETFRRLVFS